MTVRVTADGGVSGVSPPLSNEAVVTTSGTVVDSASGEEAGKASKIGEQQLYGAQMRQRVQQQARVPIYDRGQQAPGATNSVDSTPATDGKSGSQSVGRYDLQRTSGGRPASAQNLSGKIASADSGRGARGGIDR